MCLPTQSWPSRHWLLPQLQQYIISAMVYAAPAPSRSRSHFPRQIAASVPAEAAALSPPRAPTDTPSAPSPRVSPAPSPSMSVNRHVDTYLGCSRSRNFISCVHATPMACAALRLLSSYASVYRHTASSPGSRTPQHRIHQASYSVEDIPPYPAHPLASSSTQTAKPLPHHRASTRQHAPSRTPLPGRSRPFRHILCEHSFTPPSLPHCPCSLRPPHIGITHT